MRIQELEVVYAGFHDVVGRNGGPNPSTTCLGLGN